ncbi:MAG: hypothetical protein H0W28_07040 [Pyrinomonadaceae bacterium]|jgi:uncharacterized protein (DUF2336 family)|nr:hypothetical protein [Pyrinomonadaceae bacterium]
MQKKSTKRATKQVARKRDRSQTITIDLAAGQKRLEKRRLEAARLIIQMFDKSGVPDFVTDAVMDALIKASAIKGVTVWKALDDETQDFDEQLLADLFALTDGCFSLDLSKRAELAQALSTVLHSPLTAPRLFNAVGDFVTEISTPLLDDSPEMIEMALRRGQCGYGSDCPGAKDGSVCAGPETHPVWQTNEAQGREARCRACYPVTPRQRSHAQAAGFRVCRFFASHPAFCFYG